MPPTFEIDPADAVPIWRQIEEHVRRLVVSGRLASGESVPSVRDMALRLRVNPATVSKAYRRLVDGGVLTVRRGEGTFVADRPPLADARARENELRREAERYAGVAATLGADADQACRAVRDTWPEPNPDKEDTHDR